MRTIVRSVDRLQRLAVFEAAARLGSFTAAAAELTMTQPAVTRQIRSLERSLGVALFTRTANRSELTEAGRRLREQVSRGFDVIEDGLAELTDHHGSFVLAAHPGVAQLVIVPRLDELTAALGGPDLRLWLFDRDAELAGGGFDAVVRVGDGDFPGLDSRVLFQESVVPVASPTFADHYGLDASSDAGDVYCAPLVHMDDGDHPWMSWSEWFAEFDITLRREPGRVLFHNYPMVLQRALLGHGVALGWRRLIDEYVDGGALTVVGPEVRSTRSYYAAWPSGTRHPALDAVVDWLTYATRAVS